MGKEVIQGIFGGLVAIVIVVAIGSFIAQAGSHGPAHGGEAAQTEGAPDGAKPAPPAEEANEGAEQPAESE
jgi:hypothetical protein